MLVYVLGLGLFKESTYGEHLYVCTSRAGLSKIGKFHLALVG